MVSIAFVLLWSGTDPAWAAEVRVSLQEAKDLALSGNNFWLATRERALAAHARADMADRMLWPRVSLNSQWSRTDNTAMVFMGKLTSGVIASRDFEPALLNDPGSRSQLATRLQVEAPLDLFRRHEPSKQASRAMAGSADANSREHTLDLIHRVTEGYARAAVARERVSVVDAALQAARSREKEVEAQVDEGAALRGDLLRVRSRRREREAELATLTADQTGSLATLNELMGARGETTYVPGDLPRSGSGLGPVEDEATLVAKAMTHRPGLEALRLQAEAARHAAEADHRSRLPEIGLFAQLTDDRGGFSEGRQSYAIGGVVKVSLFDPTKGARQSEARIAERAAELDRLAAIDGVRRAVRNAREQVRARMAALDAARGGAEEGEEALRVVQERRREGLATLTDELETEAAALGAHLREIAAQVELVMAEAALARVTGDTQ
jgi:outer membrane protein